MESDATDRSCISHVLNNDLATTRPWHAVFLRLMPLHTPPPALFNYIRPQIPVRLLLCPSSATIYPNCTLSVSFALVSNITSWRRCMLDPVNSQLIDGLATCPSVEWFLSRVQPIQLFTTRISHWLQKKFPRCRPGHLEQSSALALRLQATFSMWHRNSRLQTGPVQITRILV